jgi:hypothetical protein
MADSGIVADGDDDGAGRSHVSLVISRYKGWSNHGDGGLDGCYDVGGWRRKERWILSERAVDAAIVIDRV